MAAPLPREPGPWAIRFPCMSHPSNSEYWDRAQDEIAHYAAIYENEQTRLALTEGVPASWSYIEFKAWERITAANQGRSAPDDVFHHLEQGGGGRILSVGSGQGSQELAIARRLREAHIPYEIICLDPRYSLVQLGQEAAQVQGLNLKFQIQDANYLSLDENEFDTIMCFTALHALRRLEHTFFELNRSLKPDGELVVVDLVTLNGYKMREETRQIVEALWQVLPERFKFNFSSYGKPRIDLEYPDVNNPLCVRTQEILHLLSENLQPKVYIPYFSLVRRFFDTMYGPCYDLSKPLDKAIVDLIWQLDVYFLESGKLAPETFLGIYTKGKVRSRSEREDIESDSLQRPSQSTTNHAEPAPAAKKKRVPFYKAPGARKGVRAESGLTGPNEKPVEGEPFAAGHFYSALPSPEDRQAYLDAERQDEDVPGIDLNLDRQLALLQSFQPYYDEAPFTAEKSAERRYFYDNGFYSYADALTLYGMMREFKPRRIIEIGSGYSSAVMLDTNEIHFNNAIELTFVEPFPNVLYSLMRGHDRQRASVLAIRVQDLDRDIFRTLDRNDILFVDSTHVTKLRSDVNKIFFDFLPVLRSGVVIHFHDIFWPFDYPKEMVRRGIAWNEAYLLRAFLQFNTNFEIVLFANLLYERHKGWLGEYMPLYLKNAGGSMWLRKK